MRGDSLERCLRSSQHASELVVSGFWRRRSEPATKPQNDAGGRDTEQPEADANEQHVTRNRELPPHQPAGDEVGDERQNRRDPYLRPTRHASPAWRVGDPRGVFAREKIGSWSSAAGHGLSWTARSRSCDSLERNDIV